MRPKRTHNFTIRLSDNEKLQWQEKAAHSGLSLSELIRLAIARTNTWTIGDLALIKEQTRQLARIGNNLNQIARWANTYKDTANAIEIIEALRLIEQCLEQLTLKNSSFPKAMGTPKVTNPLSTNPSSTDKESENALSTGQKFEKGVAK